MAENSTQAEYERTVMTVWPSNGAYAPGRWLGGLYAIRTGFSVFTVGNALAVLSIPLAIAIYCWRLLPYAGTRYRITDRRIVVQRGLLSVDERAVDLDGFDTIAIDVRPGQAWYNAGDLVFLSQEKETLRLPGVSRPEVFRSICLESHQAAVEIKKAMESQATSA